MNRTALRALVALFFCALSCASAFAHASLLKSSPQDGDLLKQAPQSVELLFNEPVDRAERLEHRSCLRRIIGMHMDSDQFAVADDEDAVADSGFSKSRRLSLSV